MKIHICLFASIFLRILQHSAPFEVLKTRTRNKRKFNRVNVYHKIQLKNHKTSVHSSLYFTPISSVHPNVESKQKRYSFKLYTNCIKIKNVETHNKIQMDMDVNLSSLKTTTEKRVHTEQVSKLSYLKKKNQNERGFLIKLGNTYFL